MSEDFASDGVFLPETLWDWTFVNDIRISRDAQRVAYVVTTVDKIHDRYTSDVWIHDLRTGEARPFTTHPAADYAPRFSPDGQRLAFISARVSPPQLFVLDLNGGEAQQVTDLDAPVAEPTWSPDSRRLALTSTARTSAERAERERLENAERQAREAPRGDSELLETAPREQVLNDFQIRRDGTPGFLSTANKARSHVWIVDLNPARNGDPLLPARHPEPAVAFRLTTGDFDDFSPTWSQDGRSVIFTSVRKPGPAAGLGGRLGLIFNDSDLFSIPVPRREPASPMRPQPIVADQGTAYEPRVSPNGEWIAYLGAATQDPPVSHVMQQLWVVRPDGSERRLLTGDLDRSIARAVLTDVASPVGAGLSWSWDPDSQALYTTVLDSGRSHIYRIALDGTWEQLTHLAGDLREVDVTAVNGKKTFVTIASTPSEPYDAWSFQGESTSATWRRLTQWNSDLLSTYAIDDYEEFRYPSFDDQEIQAFLVKPPGFDRTKKYPLVLYIHGGPHAMYGYSFFHELQVLAHHGYVVLFSNPRGSAGYGFDFGNSIQYRFPGDDARDLLIAVDKVLERGFIDERRLAVTGGSGGGLLTNWLITQDDRFAAAISQRSVSDFVSMVGTSDLGPTFMRLWFHGLPWQTPGHYQKLSPISYADRIRTPLLLIHSTEDYRTPIEQSYELYTALKAQGKTVEMVVFPEASHGLSRSGRPSQRVARLRHILRWLDTYLAR